MTDPRVKKLADLLINYSCALRSGEKVLIEAIDVPHAFTKAVVESAAAAGGHALVLLKSNEINRALMLNGSDASWNATAEHPPWSPPTGSHPGSGWRPWPTRC